MVATTSHAHIKYQEERRCQIMEVIFLEKYSSYEFDYIGYIEQTFNKIMDGHFSNSQCILKWTK